MSPLLFRSSFPTFALTILTSNLSLAEPDSRQRLAAIAPAGAADPAILGDSAPSSTDAPSGDAPPVGPPSAAQPSSDAATPSEPGAARQKTVTSEAAEPTASAESEPGATQPPGLTSPHEHVKIGGGAIVYYYQPLEEGRGNVGVFFANLLLDAQWDAFGLHIEPRFRDTKLRPFFEGPVWLQEAYASASLAPITVKVGKVYKRSGGLFWDNSFFGNVQVYDGLKLDPNYGVSVEGSVGGDFGLDFAAQYFVVDGSTNVSLQGRDTISIAGARRRHTKAAKFEPRVKLSEAGELRLGGSFEHFVADIPDAHDRVLRAGADVRLTYHLGDAGSFGVWGEFLHQSGRHVIDHPAAGVASENTDYFLVGGQYSFWKLTARYNVSHAKYESVDIDETLQVPGLGIAVNEHLTVLGELAHWRQFTPQGKVRYNDSLNITLSGRF